MLERCFKKNSKDYYRYGGRGIKVCERWLHFPFFIADMEPTYFTGAVLDRIDNYGGYSPENCRWATHMQSTVNRRCSIMIDTPWGRLNVAEAARRMGMPRGRFSTRVKLGWSFDQLFDPQISGPLTKWDRRKKNR